MAATISRRQPFGEISASRLQSLENIKNQQNAVTQSLLDAEKKKQTFDVKSPGKRQFTSLSGDDDFFDSENVDPSIFSVKKTRQFDGGSIKQTPSRFNILVDEAKPTRPCTPVKTFSPSTPRPIAIPKSPLQRSTKVVAPEWVPPFGMYTRPIGRSPVKKGPSLLQRRPLLMKRIEPPNFDSLFQAQATPKSLDETLSSTPTQVASVLPAVSSYTKPKRPVKVAAKNVPFNIHEDSADEESTNIMEHRANILDLSSDDETAAKKDERGKENIPPANHVGADLAPRSPRSPRTRGPVDVKGRVSVSPDAMVDIDENRSPLGDLPAQDFYAAGLQATSATVVEDDAE